MTQERLIKQHMFVTRFLLAITIAALLVFIGLYIDETHRVQETYRTQFNTYLSNTDASIDSYLNAEGDLPLRYRRIITDLSNANAFAFLLKDMTEDQKRTINELYTCFLKYPEQMQDTARLNDVRTAVSDMSENLDKGYDEAAEIVDSVDKKGF